jgi:putative restriction endonuclease
MARKLIFGEIKDVKEGDHFINRKIMMPSSFHRMWARGIDGDKNIGAAAICLSGGYEDDFDSGDLIIYTGAGGQENKKQVEDQSWDHPDNMALYNSFIEGYPVRVIRGHKHKSEFSPATGYTYSGLYKISDAWIERGKSIYKVCRFKLEYDGESQIGAKSINLDYRTREKKRRKDIVVRVVRDTMLSKTIKELYDYECQVCGLRIKTKVGYYAEGAHIRPLGKPHNGDDNINNLLCLCPNHHVMFDKGVFTIKDDFSLSGYESGKLNIHDEHNISIENIKYHRESYD